MNKVLLFTLKNKSIIALAIVFSFTLSTIHANKKMVSDSLSLNEIVITGTKTARNLNEIPASITVISSEKIASTPLHQLDDLLRFTPGITVNRNTGMFTQRPTITIRGLSGDEQGRTLVLLNGVPINTSDEGGVNWNRINPFDVERIEIMKGPGSSLYGNNAMGGVINIITKKPVKNQEGYAGVSYGSFNTLRQDLAVRIRNDKGYYGSVAQYYVKSDGYNNVPEADRTAYDIKRSLEEVGLSSKLGFDNSHWFNWELQYDIFKDKRGEGYQIFTPDGCYRNFNTTLLRGTLQGGNNKLKYILNTYYQLEQYYDLNEQFKGPNYVRYDVNSFREDMGALLTVTQHLFKQNTLTYGAEFKKGSIAGGDYYQTAPYDTIHNAGSIQTVAAFMQDEYALVKNKLYLLAGIRYDRVSFMDGKYSSTNPWNTIPVLNDHTWSAFSPRAGLRFNANKAISSFVSYSHGFRASILDDLTRTGWMWVGPKYANPTLGPEYIDNYELGLTIHPSKKINLSTAAYYSLGKDFLYYVATGDSLFGRSVYRRENVSFVRTRGVETDMEYHITKTVSFFASYTYCDATIEAFNERPELENKLLKYVPKHTASASIFWRNKWLSFTFIGLYKGTQFADDINQVQLDSYLTFDLQLAKEINNKYIVSLAVQDLFDNKHMETNNYTSPGRIISGRVALKF